MKRICIRCNKLFERKSKYNKICEDCCAISLIQRNVKKEEIELKKQKTMKKTMELIKISKDIEALKNKKTKKITKIKEQIARNNARLDNIRKQYLDLDVKNSFIKQELYMLLLTEQ